MNDHTCKHYNGSVNTHCKAGVCYRDVTTDPDILEGSGLRIPCHNAPMKKASASQLEHFKRRGKCDKFELPTKEEIAADEAEVTAMFDRMAKCLPIIGKVKKEHKGTNWTGVVECLVCGGKLHLSHAALNGHVWGKCETENCVSWME